MIRPKLPRLTYGWIAEDNQVIRALVTHAVVGTETGVPLNNDRLVGGITVTRFPDFHHGAYVTLSSILNLPLPVGTAYHPQPHLHTRGRSLDVGLRRDRLRCFCRPVGNRKWSLWARLYTKNSFYTLTCHICQPTSDAMTRHHVLICYHYCSYEFESYVQLQTMACLTPWEVSTCKQDLRGKQCTITFSISIQIVELAFWARLS